MPKLLLQKKAQRNNGRLPRERMFTDISRKKLLEREIERERDRNTCRQRKSRFKKESAKGRKGQSIGKRKNTDISRTGRDGRSPKKRMRACAQILTERDDQRG